MSLHSSRSRSPDEKDSNSETERPRSASPVPRVVNEEWFRSAHAVFVKRWYRGHNTCSRCDFEYFPVRGQQSHRRLEDKAPKTSQQQLPQHPQYHLQQQQQSVSNRATPGSSSLVKEIKEERKPDIKREVPESTVPRKKLHYDTAPSSDAQITSSLMGGTALPPYILDHPAFRGYPMMHDPTPALRQLSEYAKPHIGGGGTNTDRNAVPGASFDPFSRFSGLYQPSAKERLDLETEKRGERADVRNRDSWEGAKDKVKLEMDFKPQDRTPSYPSAGMLDAHLLELQKRYGSTVPPGGAGGNLLPVNLPGVFPPAYLTAEWMRRERERLELLGAGGMMPNLSAVDASFLSERLLAERLHAERLNERLMLPADPIYRLEMAGLGTANVSEQSHTTHTHSHTHLHLHQPDAAAAAAAALYPPFHPLVASAPHLLPTPGFALPAVGMNSLTGGNPSAPGIPGTLPFGPSVPHPAYSFAASQQLMAAARDQDLYYRELLSRPPYSTDPILNQQLTAQAIAHQEAVQRQLAVVERDRLGAGLHGAVLPR